MKNTPTPKNSRRGFIATATAGLIGAGIINTSAHEHTEPATPIAITGLDVNHIYKPLEKITLTAASPCNIAVFDGSGRQYASASDTSSITFMISGTLGYHVLVATNKKGMELSRTSFEVNAKTTLNDGSGTYNKLFRQMYWTMIGSEEGSDMGRGGEAFPFYVEDEFYFTFVPWLRDHVHTLKGMKYFYPNVKSAIDLFAKYQRADGMVWDNFGKRKKEPSMWDKRFAYGGFIQPVDNYKFEFKRIPVEADMEFIFLEGIYVTWQATGDNQWMMGKLDNALRAVKYCTSDPYRWSAKYQLIKRGFTIDTWDFQCEEDAAVAGGDHMCIDKDKTRFGIMYGDNTGFIHACQKLAIMLETANRKEDAKRIAQLAADMQQRLDALAWNGKFYTHHVPEDLTVKRDLGVNLSESFSLSNSYSLNRNIGHDKCVSIINKYKELYKIKPANGLGEWYGIYPPFTKGFGDDAAWEYVNGGVLSLVAGELAHGAFENGAEDYAVDILNRVSALASKYNDFLHGSFKGRIPEKPTMVFQPITLDKYNNVSFSGENAGKATPWTKEGKNDLHEMVVGKQTFLDIPFQITDPAANSSKACIGISTQEGYLPSASIAVGQKAGSIYLLHTKAGPSAVGFVKIIYKDLTTYADEINAQKIDGWWMPGNKPQFKVAWKGTNDKAPYVGVGIYGLNNPFPEKEIKEIVLENGKSSDTKWFVLGITLSDSKVYFKPEEKSHGIPDRWGAAAVMYALAEGLIGIVDTGSSYSATRIAPRWAATKETKVNTVFKYEASQGYVAYNLQQEPTGLRLQVATNAKQRNYEILLPATKKATSVKVNGKVVVFENKQIQNSQYVCWKSNTIGTEDIEIAVG